MTRINLPIGVCQGPVISISRLWLKRRFDIHAQIALPTGRLKPVHDVAFIDIYLWVLLIKYLIYL